MSVVDRSSVRILMTGFLLLLGGCSPDTSPQQETPTIVASYQIQAGNGDTTTHLSGRIKAAENTTLGFEIPGEIAQLSVKAGDKFAAGDVLATLDDERYQLVAQQRQAELREAAAVLTEKRQDYQRQSQLAQKGYVSATGLDAARAALDSAESRHAASIAASHLAQRDLKQTSLIAPFDGSITQRQAEPSEQVSAGQPILQTISDREGFEVEASVPEALVKTLVIGSHHQVSIPALGGAASSATLTHLGTQPLSSNDYPLLLKLESPIEGLRSGMTARIEILLNTPAGDDTQGFPIPLTALAYASDRSAYVLRIDEQGQLQRVAVEVVDINDARAKVRGELTPGQRIVARGTEFVRPGQAVSLLGEGPERYN
jgi:RND family efflux transporter MFP subunit